MSAAGEDRALFGSVSFTETEKSAIQRALKMHLGPEFIKYRPGSGGQQVAYLEGCKAVELANETFGFNGWSSSVNNITVDFLERDKTGSYSIGVTAIVRVTLKDGSFHEDVGYGNGKGPSRPQVIEKAKKQACTDALKRALKTFGNSLGQCLSDKEYLRALKSTGAYKPLAIDLSQARTSTFNISAPPPSPSRSAPTQSTPQQTHGTTSAPAQPVHAPPHALSAPLTPNPNPNPPAPAHSMAAPAPVTPVQNGAKAPPPVPFRPQQKPQEPIADDDLISEELEIFLNSTEANGSDDSMDGWPEGAPPAAGPANPNPAKATTPATTHAALAGHPAAPRAQPYTPSSHMEAAKRARIEA